MLANSQNASDFDKLRVGKLSTSKGLRVKIIHVSPSSETQGLLAGTMRYFYKFASGAEEPLGTYSYWISSRRDRIPSCWLGRKICKVAFWFGAIARKGACTVISRSFACSVDIVAWPGQRQFAFCTSWKVSEVIQLAISSVSLNFFSETLHDNLPIARAKQISWSMMKTTSCKKATALPG